MGTFKLVAAFSVLLSLSIPVWAQKNIEYGRTVTIRSTSTNTFNSVFGNIQRYDINNNNPSFFGNIYNKGNARCANISPDGNRVAFLRQDNKICIINIDGSGSAQVLGSITNGATGYIDWPMNEWIYYSPEGITGHKGAGGNARSGLHRINTNTGATENLGNVQLAGTWRIHVSRDGTRAVVTGWGLDGGWKANLVELTNNKISNIRQQSPCGGSLSPDGSLYTVNQGGHDDVLIRRFNDDVQVASWSTSRCSNAGPNWNRQRWSSNSRDWVTFTQGEPYQMQNYHNQVLYYVPDNGRTCIQVTNNAGGAYNEGDDLWIQFATEPAIGLNPSSLQFQAELGGQTPASKTVAVSNIGTGTLPSLNASSNRRWLDVSMSGNGNQYTVTNAIDLNGVAGGIHNATVKIAGADIDDATYSVQLTVVSPPVLTTIEASNAYVAPGAQVQCEAVGFDQYGEVLQTQPQLTWTLVEGGGTITSAGMYTAPAREGTARVKVSGGGGTITAEATITVSTVPPIHLKIDCSSSPASGWESDQAYLVEGNEWRPDFVFDGNVDVSNVLDPAPPAVYLSAPLSKVANSYSLPDLPNSFYLVRLHTMLGTGHNGVFKQDWTIEGEKVLDDFDIKTDAGGFDLAVVMEFVVEVKDDNGLQIVCTNDGGVSAYVGGMEIIATSSGEPQGPAITVLSPNGGETFTEGELMTVRWEGDTDRVSTVLVELSTNNGESWDIISGAESIAAFEVNTEQGSFSWTVPATLGDQPLKSETCLIRVRDYMVPNFADVSDAVFGIGAGAAVAQEARRKDRSVPALINRAGNCMVRVPGGTHDVRIYDLSGTQIAHYSGSRPGVYPVGGERSSPGAYIVRVLSGGLKWEKLFTLPE